MSQCSEVVNRQRSKFSPLRCAEWLQLWVPQYLLLTRLPVWYVF